jgi:hypothetical protein
MKNRMHPSMGGDRKKRMGKVGREELGYAGFLRWESKAALGWRIGYGVSNFLVAEGSGFSRQIGRAMFERWTSQ